MNILDIKRKMLPLGNPQGDSGGGGSAPAQTTQTQDLPDWAKPYAQEVLGKGSALSNAPYQAYQGERIAQFTPLQQRAFQGAANMQPSAATQQGIGIAGQAAQKALNIGYGAGPFQNQFQAPGQYDAGQFGAQQVQAPNLQNYQMQGPADVQSQGYNAASMGTAQSGYNPQLQTFQMGPAERVAGQGYDAATMQAAQTRFAPELERFQMGPAERVQTQSFAQPGSADAYMSPYMQSVVGIQQREAQRAADIAGTQRGAEAVKSGAFGGSRQAIMDAEAARNLAQQKGDIQATGLQAAFQQAQGQFNAEQNARLQAQQANQQAGLTTGQQNLAANLGVQQLGTQTGLQTALANLSSEQQANVQNQAARNQSMGMNAQQAMQAALANQQAGLTVGQQNLASQQATQQLGAGQIGLQTSLANLSAAQQANVQNQAAQNQAMGMNAQQALQAALANQQTGLATGQQNLAANLGVQQLGSGQNMQAQLANQQQNIEAQRLAEQSRQFGAGQGMTAAQQAAQYGQAAQQLQEQSRQYGAGLGLQGLQTALTGAGQLGALGGQQFTQGMDINKLQAGYGTQQQQQVQNILGQQYEDFLAQKKFPYQQLEFQSNLLRGTPSGSTQSIYTAQPSTASQVLGAGTALGGAYLMGGRANGGVVSSYAKGGAVKKKQKSAGLAELALSKI
jgi:hypothetical protein